MTLAILLSMSMSISFPLPSLLTTPEMLCIAEQEAVHLDTPFAASQSDADAKLKRLVSKNCTYD